MSLGGKEYPGGYLTIIYKRRETGHRGPAPGHPARHAGIDTADQRKANLVAATKRHRLLPPSPQSTCRSWIRAPCGLSIGSLTPSPSASSEIIDEAAPVAFASSASPNVPERWSRCRLRPCTKMTISTKSRCCATGGAATACSRSVPAGSTAENGRWTLPLYLERGASDGARHGLTPG